MITLGTGRLSHKEEQELGLAGEHDYAVLDMKEIESQRLFLVKNPWCDGMVWKRPLYISEQGNGPKYIRNEILHEPVEAATPGSFWMKFEHVVQNFESLYLNWNPGLFRNRQDHHFSWVLPLINNPGSFTHNPQYAVKSDAGGTAWILLSRHFVTGEQDIVSNNKSKNLEGVSGVLGFISLYVFESNGRRVYLSDDAFHRGAFVDSPQTLVRIDMAPSTYYTIVVAQHGLPLPKYSFSLSFFSRSHLAVEAAIETLPYSTTHNGAWTLRTAGGNASASSYPLNPQFSISIPSPTDVLLFLETDEEELAVQVKMVWAGGERVTEVTSRDIVGGSGEYRRGCALAEIRNVSAGRYTIVCSTFEAQQTGSFTLRIGSMVACEVRPVLAETAGRLSIQLPILIFKDGVDRLLAPLMSSRMTRLRIIARCGGSNSTQWKSRPLLKVSLERSQGPNKAVLSSSGNGEFSDAPMGIRTMDVDVSPEMSQTPGLWIVVERLGGRNSVDEVEVEILSERPVIVGLWGTGDG